MTGESNRLADIRAASEKQRIARVPVGCVTVADDDVVAAVSVDIAERDIAGTIGGEGGSTAFAVGASPPVDPGPFLLSHLGGFPTREHEVLVTVAVDVSCGDSHWLDAGKGEGSAELAAGIYRYEQGAVGEGGEDVWLLVELNNLDEWFRILDVLVRDPVESADGVFDLRSGDRENGATRRVDPFGRTPVDGDLSVVRAGEQFSHPVLVQVSRADLVGVDLQVDVAPGLESKFGLVEYSDVARRSRGEGVVTQESEVGAPVTVEVSGSNGRASRGGKALASALAPSVGTPVVDGGVHVGIDAVVSVAEYEVVEAVAVQIEDGTRSSAVGGELYVVAVAERITIDPYWWHLIVGLTVADDNVEVAVLVEIEVVNALEDSCPGNV